jgi:hypothetical protein
MKHKTSTHKKHDTAALMCEDLHLLVKREHYQPTKQQTEHDKTTAQQHQNRYRNRNRNHRNHHHQ